jgi:hypothetical protein
MMGTEVVPETSVSSCNQFTRLCAREDFIEFSRRESFKLYNFNFYFSESSYFGGLRNSWFQVQKYQGQTVH